MHRTAYEKHLLSLDSYFFLETPQMKTFSLPVKIVYSNTMSVFLDDRADKRENSAACAKGRFQRVFRTARMHFSLKKEMFISARTAEKDHPLSLSRTADD